MGTIREITRKDGTKSYHVEIRKKGYPPQRASFRTKTLAKKWEQQTEAAIQEGRHFKTIEAKKHTVGEMIDKFISQWLPKHPKRQPKQTALLLWWKKTCGHILLSDLSSATIAECRDHLLNEKTIRGTLRSPSTVNRYLSAFGKVLNIAMKEWGWIEDTPMRKISKPQEGEGRNRFLSPSEKDRLLQECRNSRNLNLYPMVALSILTGIRFGELARLRWGDIDLDRNSITLQQTKNGERRVIPLASEAKEILKGCPSYGAHLEDKIFKAPTSPNGSKLISVREAFAKALERASIDNFRWHDLRHTAASYMAMSGATQGELMAILGHKTPAMTRRYAHYSQKHLAALLERTSSTLNLQREEVSNDN